MEFFVVVTIHGLLMQLMIGFKAKISNLGVNDDKNTAGNYVRRQGKGFVYSNLVLHTSNLVSVRIQKDMLSYYGEYIAVRKK